MNTKFSSIFDYIFARTLVAIILFIWVRLYTTLTLALVYTAALMACLIIIFDIVLKSRKNKQSQKRKELAHCEEIMSQLCIGSDIQNLDFFNKMLSTRHSVKVENSCLTVDVDGEKIPVYLRFLTNKLTPSNITEIVKDSSIFAPKKILILSIGATPAATTLIDQIEGIDITVYDDQKVYEMLKDYNTFPELTVKINKKRKKYHLRELATYALSRKRVKGYFFASLFLLFGSFFMGYALYYRIAAIVLMILALVSLKNINLTKTKSRNII